MEMPILMEHVSTVILKDCAGRHVLISARNGLIIRSIWVSKFDYNLLGDLIIQNGIEKGVHLFFTYGGEEHFAKQIGLLEKDLFASTECLETLIKHFMYEYLSCYGKEDYIEDVFSPMVDLVEKCDERCRFIIK